MCALKCPAGGWKTPSNVHRCRSFLTAVHGIEYYFTLFMFKMIEWTLFLMRPFLDHPWISLVIVPFGYVFGAMGRFKAMVFTFFMANVCMFSHPVAAKLYYFLEKHMTP